ncbi:hypothetical protein [Tomitella cavernea]|uniref:Uncharacterized protein n=1 Tax=Tomitella cavernea TaxID=1387982 RepID=A0ABP9C7S5_9ACTN|nr:hypothetical protein [Tomitella cavernea]
MRTGRARGLPRILDHRASSTTAHPQLPRTLNYDVDSADWKGTSTGTIRAAVAQATAGSVNSRHLGRSNTVAALPVVLEDLGAHGLTGVTGTELLR